MKIKPNPSCPTCNGSGEVCDYVPYGSTNVLMLSYCNCVEKQIPEDYDGDIELVHSLGTTQEEFEELVNAVLKAFEPVSNFIDKLLNR